MRARPLLAMLLLLASLGSTAHAETPDQGSNLPPKLAERWQLREKRLQQALENGDITPEAAARLRERWARQAATIEKARGQLLDGKSPGSKPGKPQPESLQPQPETPALDNLPARKALREARKAKEAQKTGADAEGQRGREGGGQRGRDGGGSDRGGRDGGGHGGKGKG